MQLIVHVGLRWALLLHVWNEKNSLTKQLHLTKTATEQTSFLVGIIIKYAIDTCMELMYNWWLHLILFKPVRGLHNVNFNLPKSKNYLVGLEATCAVPNIRSSSGQWFTVILYTYQKKKQWYFLIMLKISNLCRCMTIN